MRLGDHRLTLLLFVAVAVLFVVMGGYFPAALAIPLPGSAIRPVLLFEFAANPQHLIHVFGGPGDPLRATRIAGMNTGNALDFLLMPSYGLLTLSFFIGLSRELSGNVWKVFGAMGLVAAAADAFENALLLGITSNMADPLSEIALLPYPVWIKFGLLAITCGGAAWGFVRMRRWVLAALCVPAPLLIVPAWLDPYGLAPTATALIGLGWLAMAIHAGTRLLRERKA
jgi:hypothetical protein